MRAALSCYFGHVNLGYPAARAKTLLPALAHGLAALLFLLFSQAAVMADDEPTFALRVKAKCPTCDVQRAVFASTPWVNMNFAGQNLAGADFSNATLSGVSFAGANLSGANFSGATINDSGGVATVFTGANLTNTNFTGAVMSAADIQYATLSCTNFTNANMSGVIAGAALPGLNSGCAPVFTGATVDCNIAAFSGQLQLSGATIPSGCSQSTPQAAQDNVTGSPAWSCAGTTPSGFDNWTYVAASGGSDSNACTSAAPCASIAAALAACPSTGSCGALVYYGSFSVAQPIALGPNRAIYGACLNAPASPDASQYYSVITMTTAGAPVVSASAAKQSALSFLHLAASGATGNSGVSVGLQATDGSSLTLNSVSILAGKGNEGVSGASATTVGANGAAANGQNGGTSTCGAQGGQGGNGQDGTAELNPKGFKIYPTCSPSCTGTCSGSNGVPGGAGASGNYSNGGPVGSVVCGTNIKYNCDDGTGHPGQSGANGPSGPGGVASQNVTGNYTSSGWQPSVGGAGQAGGNGGAGGGGGGGGMCAANSVPFEENVHSGRVGGGGGAGGCGGPAGAAGTQGGASMAAILDASTLTVTNVSITGGTGGRGGNGGSSQTGGQGAAAAGGGVKSGGYSQGGPGGAGAPGGSGGGGAGGNGGPAFGIVLVNGAAVTGTPFYYTGYSGDVGLPGSAPNTANNILPALGGAQGTPGRVANTATFQY